MEQIAQQEQEKMLEARLRELPFFNQKISGTDVNRFNLDTYTWLSTQRPDGPAPVDKAKEYEQKLKEHASDIARLGKSVDRESLSEKARKGFIDALKVREIKDGERWYLSPEMVARAEELSGDPDQQEAFLRGYTDRRYQKAISRFVQDRDFDVPKKDLPKNWQPMFEGMLGRSLEDSQISGKLLQRDVEVASNLKKTTGVDLLAQCRGTIEEYLERQRQWKQERGREPFRDGIDSYDEGELTKQLEAVISA